MCVLESRVKHLLCDYKINIISYLHKPIKKRKCIVCANWDTLCTILSCEYGVRLKVIWRLLFSVHRNCLMSRSPDLVSCQGYLKLKVVLLSVTEIVSCQSNLKQCHVKVTWSGVMSKLPEAVSCQGYLKRCHVKLAWSGVMSRLPEAVSCQGYQKRCHVKVTWSGVMSRLPEAVSCQSYLKRCHVKVTRSGVMSRLPEVVSCQGYLKQCHVKVTWSGVMSRWPEAVSCQGYLKQCHVKGTWSEVSLNCKKHLSTDNKTSSGIKYCMTALTRYSWINNMDQCITNRCYMCIQRTCVLYSVVITWQYNPPISQFNSPCHEFTSVWSMFVYNTWL